MSNRLLVLFVLICLVGSNGLAVDDDVFVTVHEMDEGFLVEASIKAPVSQKVAWEVLIDYDHMANILSNLSTSQVISHNGNHLIVKQAGIVRYGPFSQSYRVEREVRLEPMTRILTKNLSGSLKRMESEVRLKSSGDGLPTAIKYRAEFVFDSILANLFAESFLSHEVEEQFHAMIGEMKRRDAQLSTGMRPQIHVPSQ